MSRAVLACLVAAVALSTSMASAAPRAESSAAAADTVVFALPTDVVGGFNAVLRCCAVASSLHMGFEEAIHGAYIQNDKGEWVPDLAHGSASTKGLTYTINPKASWYWGGRKFPVTYRDFVYTLQQFVDPNNDVGRTGYSNLDPNRFEHKGDRQVTFFWRTSGCADSPCKRFAEWKSLFNTLYPGFALAGLDFNTMWTKCICGNDGKPVANGPFYLADYTKGRGSTLVRNPYWGGTKPRIARIVFQVMADANLLVAALRTATIDAVYPPYEPALLPLKGAPGIAFDVAGSYNLEHLELREGSAKGAPTVEKGASNKLLLAPWMRQAISLAIDEQAVIDKLYPGLGVKPNDSLLFFSTQPGYRPTFARWRYNPARALALLKAHCTGGPSKPSVDNKKVWECAGLPATIRWSWRATSTPRTQIEALAKTNLQAVGIQVIDWPLADFFGPTGVGSGDFDIADFAVGGSGDPGDLYDSLRCFGDANVTGYCSHTVDALLTAANSELDETRRTALFQRADALLAAEVPWIPLFAQPALLIHKSTLVGMSAGDPFWNVEDWRWKR